MDGGLRGASVCAILSGVPRDHEDCSDVLG